MKNVQCPLCSELTDLAEPECRHCSGLLKDLKPSPAFLRILFLVGFVYAVFTIWVGYNILYALITA